MSFAKIPPTFAAAMITNSGLSFKKNLSVLEEKNLSRLVDNYEIKNSSIVILRYDEKKLNVFLKTNLAGPNKVKQIDFGLENLENC